MRMIGTEINIEVGKLLANLGGDPNTMNTVWAEVMELVENHTAELEQQLEEAKQVKLEGMEMPAYKLMQDFAKFMDEALESDRPMTTDWCVRMPDGEEVVVLNIWAATTHDSPISRAQELVGKVSELEARNAALVEALEEINNIPTKMQETIDIYKESGYQLKTDSELIAKIAEFGFGELEFHTADIERLVTQSGVAFNALEANGKDVPHE
jgi:hypothetical protein